MRNQVCVVLAFISYHILIIVYFILSYHIISYHSVLVAYRYDYLLMFFCLVADIMKELDALVGQQIPKSFIKYHHRIEPFLTTKREFIIKRVKRGKDTLKSLSRL